MGLQAYRAAYEGYFWECVRLVLHSGAQNSLRTYVHTFHAPGCSPPHQKVRPASTGCSLELCLRRTPAQPTSSPIAGGRAGSVSTQGQATAPVAHARRIAVNAYGTVLRVFAPFRESERRAHERSRRLLCSFEAPDTRQTPSLCRTHLETVSGLVQAVLRKASLDTEQKAPSRGVEIFSSSGYKTLISRPGALPEHHPPLPRVSDTPRPSRRRRGHSYLATAPRSAEMPR